MDILKTSFFYFFVFFSALCTVQAQEKSLLEQLVNKKVLSDTEAQSLKKQMVSVVQAHDDMQKVRFSGMIQTQYNMMESVMGDDYDRSFDGFYLRRIFLTLQSDVTDTLNVMGRVDFIRKNTNNADYILDAYLTQKIDYGYLNGNLQLGIRKVQFGYEETIPCTALSSIETSLATRYFSYSERVDGRLGFGQRYVGVFFNGNVKQIKGLKYNFAITNAINNSITPRAHLSGKSTNPESADAVNVWFATDYTTEISKEAKLRFGLKTGYGNQANIAVNSAGETVYGAIAAVNPFIEFKYEKDFIMWAEYLCANVQCGKNDATQYALPQGYNAQVEYIIDIGKFGRLGFVVRGAQLFSDGRGISIKDSINYCQDPSTSLVSRVLFNEASSIYAGINWYILGDDMKFQAGYEWSKFDSPLKSSAGSNSGRIDCVRAQIQIMF